jgi:hypothetical protein
MSDALRRLGRVSDLLKSAGSLGSSGSTTLNPAADSGLSALDGGTHCGFHTGSTGSTARELKLSGTGAGGGTHRTHVERSVGSISTTPKVAVFHGFAGDGTHGTQGTHAIDVVRTEPCTRAVPSLDAEAVSAAPCPVCRCGLWWRVSVLSGGPGPWRCVICDPAPADVWQDAQAVPGGRWSALSRCREAVARRGLTDRTGLRELQCNPGAILLGLRSQLK